MKSSGIPVGYQSAGLCVGFRCRSRRTRHESKGQQFSALWTPRTAAAGHCYLAADWAMTGLNSVLFTLCCCFLEYAYTRKKSAALSRNDDLAHRGSWVLFFPMIHWKANSAERHWYSCYFSRGDFVLFSIRRNLKTWFSLAIEDNWHFSDSEQHFLRRQLFSMCLQCLECCVSTFRAVKTTWPPKLFSTNHQPSSGLCPSALLDLFDWTLFCQNMPQFSKFWLFNFFWHRVKMYLKFPLNPLSTGNNNIRAAYLFT